MKQFLYAAAFLLPMVTAAQQATPPAATASAAAPDTAVYRAFGGILFTHGTIRLLDGHTIQGYVPISPTYPGIGGSFGYFLTNPNSKPKPKPQKMDITRVHSITAGTHYLETMLLPDGAEIYDPEILAERFVNGPVEVFLLAEPQQIPVPIPVGGFIGSAGIPFTNSQFFVRRNGFLMQVGRSSFKKVMSDYLQDYPELATKVREGEKDYHYRNLISIITEFNDHLGSTTGTGR